LADLFDIGVGEARGSSEEHLELLSRFNKSLPGAAFFLLGGLIDFIVRGLHISVASPEVILVDGVPVDEQIDDRAVISREEANELVESADGQAVILEFKGLDVGACLEHLEEHLQRIGVDPVL